MERGTALHKALELFIAKYSRRCIARRCAGAATDRHRRPGFFADAGIPKAALALWRPRFAGCSARLCRFGTASAAAVIAQIPSGKARAHENFPRHRRRLYPVGTSRTGSTFWRMDASAAILDYKTGVASNTGRQVARICWRRNCHWKAPSCPQGGFADIGKRRGRRTDLSQSLASDEKKAGKPVA